MNYLVTIDLQVTDPEVLWKRAYASFEEENGTADQGDFEIRYGTLEDPNIEACLIQIIDPGHLPGGEIIETSVESY